MSLEIKRLCVRLGSGQVLSDLSLTVEKGAFFSLLGPSGCGKSTLLKAIAGLLPHQSGSIALGGREIDHLPPYKRGIGLVFQDLRLFPHLTVAENIAFPLRMAGIKRAARRERALELLELVQLTGLAARTPARLSGGQQQRVALARALAAEPRVLLLDEPFSSLDANLREEMRRLTRQLHDKIGVTTVLVTHDQREALMLSDRMAVMGQGHTLQQGAPRELYRQPVSLEVARYFSGSEIAGQVVGGRFVSRVFALDLPAPLPEGDYVALLRPGDLELDMDMAAGAFVVEHVEYLGEHSRVLLCRDGVTIPVLTAGDSPPRPGDTAGVRLRTEQPLFFPTAGDTW